MKTFLFILASLMVLCAGAQQELKIQLSTPANVSIYVPPGNTGKLPAVIFVPGLGEQNTDINGLYVHGPMKFIPT